MTRVKRETVSRAVAVPSRTDNEDEFWRALHAGRTYVADGTTYETDYAPAYRYGTVIANEHGRQSFDDVEKKARTGWTKARGKSRLNWNEARDAVRDAYDRTIELREERLKVDKRTDTHAGEVKLKKQIRTDRQTMNVPVEREEVVVERRPVNRRVTGGTIKEEEIRIPVSREKVNVGKDTVVREKVKVGKRKVTDNRKVEGDVRREELRVEKRGRARVRETGGSRKSR